MAGDACSSLVRSTHEQRFPATRRKAGGKEINGKLSKDFTTGRRDSWTTRWTSPSHWKQRLSDWWETGNLRRIKRLSGTEFPTSDDCVHFSDSCFIGCKSRCVIAHAPCCAGNRFTMRTRDEQGGYGSAAHRQKAHPWCAIIRRWISMRNDAR